MELDELTKDIWVVRDTATGLWWRPEACGYTHELAAAGICDEETAKKWATKKSPNRHGNYQDEAIPLSKALVPLSQTLNGRTEGTVLRELISRMKGDGLSDRERAWAQHLAGLIRQVGETELSVDEQVQGLLAVLDDERRKFAETHDVVAVRLEVANEDMRKLSKQAKHYRTRAEAAEEMLEHAKGGAEIRRLREKVNEQHAQLEMACSNEEVTELLESEVAPRDAMRRRGDQALRECVETIKGLQDTQEVRGDKYGMMVDNLVGRAESFLREPRGAQIESGSSRIVADLRSHADCVCPDEEVAECCAIGESRLLRDLADRYEKGEHLT